MCWSPRNYKSVPQLASAGQCYSTGTHWKINALYLSVIRFLIEPKLHMIRSSLDFCVNSKSKKAITAGQIVSTINDLIRNWMKFFSEKLPFLFESLQCMYNLCKYNQINYEHWQNHTLMYYIYPHNLRYKFFNKKTMTLTPLKQEIDTSYLFCCLILTSSFRVILHYLSKIYQIILCYIQ